jgi:hypothetical protein
VAELVDFQRLTLHRGRRRERQSHSSKGHAEEMVAWLEFLRGLAPHPLPYAASRRSMCLTFAVIESIQQARAIAIDLKPEPTPHPAAPIQQP